MLESSTVASAPGFSPAGSLIHFSSERGMLAWIQKASVPARVTRAEEESAELAGFDGFFDDDGVEGGGDGGAGEVELGHLDGGGGAFEEGFGAGFERGAEDEGFVDGGFGEVFAELFEFAFGDGLATGFEIDFGAGFFEGGFGFAEGDGVVGIVDVEERFAFGNATAGDEGGVLGNDAACDFRPDGDAAGGDDAAVCGDGNGVVFRLGGNGLDDFRGAGFFLRLLDGGGAQEPPRNAGGDDEDDGGEDEAERFPFHGWDLGMGPPRARWRPTRRVRASRRRARVESSRVWTAVRASMTGR